MQIPKRYIYTPAVRNIVRNNARDLRAETKVWNDPAHRRVAIRAISEFEGRILRDLKEST